MKKIISLFLALTMVVCSFSFVFASDEILITTAEELAAVATDVANDANSGAGKTYKLMANIDLQNAEWSNLIGTTYSPFKGTFDGNGHIVKNFTLPFDSQNVATTGLFGCIGGNAVVKNLGVENVSCVATSWHAGTGGIVGSAIDNATIEGCYANNANITGSESNGFMRRSGGIVGFVDGAGVVIKNCYSVNIPVQDGWADEDGGIVGGIHNVASIENCYSTATIGRVKDQSLAAKTSNCFHLATNPWPAENYVGTKITEDELKTKAADLSDAFVADSESFPQNSGYPILSWQVNEKILEGDATIVTSTPANNAVEVDFVAPVVKIEFSKMIDVSTLTNESVVVDGTADYEIVAEGEYADLIEIHFGELELNTSYTISFTDAVKTLTDNVIADGQTITFKTVAQLPAMKVVSTTPANNAVKVDFDGLTVKAKYSLPVDVDTLEKEDITVTPAADFNVSLAGDNETVEIEFTSALEARTNYTVKFGTGIDSIYGNAAEAFELKFKTNLTFGNMVENSDMEDLTGLSNYGDKNNNDTLSIIEEQTLKGTKNNVLRLTAAWADQPIELTTTSVEAGSFYMGAWVMAEADQQIVMAYNGTDSDYWLSVPFAVKANEWKYIETVFNATCPSVQISIRSQGGAVIYVDDWCLYDLGSAPETAAELKSTSIEDGATNVSPYDLKMNLTFNNEVRVSSLLNGISVSNDAVIKGIEYDAYDTKNVTVKFDTLAPGEEYTLSFDNLKDIKGNAVTAAPVTFTTFAAPVADTNVISTTPANNATGIGTKDLVIKVVFDAPINADTISNIKASPELKADYAMSETNVCEVIMTVKNGQAQFDETYTVTVPNTVETVNGFKAVPYSFSFATKTTDDVTSAINAAIGNKDDMKAAIEDVYEQLPTGSASYEYVLSKLPELADSMYEELSKIDAVDSVDDINYALNSTAMSIILDNVTDKAEIAEILKNAEGLLDESIQTLYTDYLTDSQRLAIAKLAMDLKDEDFATLQDKVTFEIVKVALKSTGGSTAVKKVLYLVSDILTGTSAIDELLEEADDLQKAAKVYGELQGLEITSYADIQTALSEAIDKYPDPDGNGSGLGGGGGAGGGSIRNPGNGAAGFIPVMPDESTNNAATSNSVFGDLLGVEWARESIEALYEKGIINGKGEGVFDPDGLITRKEFAKIAVLALDLYDANATCDFVDLPKDDWSYAYVASAYNAGLINGIGNGMFGGDSYITREDVATILARMAEKAGLELTKDVLFFTDEAEISDYAKDSVKLLSSNGIVNGTGNGKFEPKGNATRAQSAVIFDRFLEKSGK